MSVVGGYNIKSVLVDDPVPITARGMWFDGKSDHFAVSGLTVNHSFTLEFFLRHKLGPYDTGSLFASYRSPYDLKPGTTYSLKLSQETLMFVQQPTNMSVVAAGAEFVADTW